MVRQEHDRGPDPQLFRALGDGRGHDLRCRTDIAAEMVFTEPDRIEA